MEMTGNNQPVISILSVKSVISVTSVTSATRLHIGFVEQ
jgi:hypothetical protein